MGDTDGINRLATLNEQLVKNQTKPEMQTELFTASKITIESQIQEIVYSPEDGNTFEQWWKKHVVVFEIDLYNRDGVKKVHLLIRHIGTSVERTFVESIERQNTQSNKEVTGKKQTPRVNTVTVASLATSSNRNQTEINGKTASMFIYSGALITIIKEETWKQLGMPDCSATDDSVISEKGDDLKRRRRFPARISYCGSSATGDVQVAYGCRNILSKNLKKLQDLAEVKGRVVKAGAPEANPNEDHTVQKVIARVTTPEHRMQVQYPRYWNQCKQDFSKVTWREFKESQCATMNCTPSRPRSARLERIRGRGECSRAGNSSSFEGIVKVKVPEASSMHIVKASASEANFNGKYHTEQKVIAKDHTEEKVIAQHDFSEETWREFEESQCATRNCTPTRPRRARPENIQSEYGTEIFLQQSKRNSDTVRVTPEYTVVRKSSFEEKNKAKFKPMSDSDNPIQCNHLSSAVDGKRKDANDERDRTKIVSVGYQEHDRTPDGLHRCRESTAINFEKGTVKYEINAIGKKQSAIAIQSRMNESVAQQNELKHIRPTYVFDLMRHDPVMDQRDEFRGELNEDPQMELGEWNVQSDASGKVNANSSPSATTSSSPLRHQRRRRSLQSSSQQDLICTLEGKPHKKIIEGKPHKLIEGKPQKKTYSKETNQ